jgi:hypothetical protein
MLKQDSQGEEKGNALLEQALKLFVKETGWKPRSSVPSSIYHLVVVYDREVWLTVARGDSMHYHCTFMLCGTL